jgi:chromosome segregation ATPase
MLTPYQLNPSRPRSSALLNVNDPVAMHLLMETAIGDSTDYEVLSFEEVEEMKKEYSILSNRIEAARRKLALESKLRDAAQSLNRLYSTKKRESGGKIDGSPGSPKKHRRSLLGSRGSENDVVSKTDDELAASTRKCEELANELWRLEKRAQELQRRILHHTAGILQMTHKGFKRDGMRDALPRSPESMRSYSNKHGSLPTIDAIDEFDDRSLYRDPDHLDEFGGGYSRRASGKPGEYAQHIQAMKDTEKRLEDLNNRLREMILQANPNQNLEPAPKAVTDGPQSQPGAGLQSHLDYLESSLEAMDSSQTRALQNLERSVFDTEERLEDLNIQLHTMIKKSGSKDSNVQPPPAANGRSLPVQISYLGIGLDNIEQQVEEITKQKGILTTQIQQQRDLNSKSDAQKDAEFSEMHQELSLTKKTLETTERDHRSTRDELVLVMEQLDAARQESMLREQQRTMDEGNALRAEKEGRRKLEASLMADMKIKQEEISGLDTKLHQLMDESEEFKRQAESKIQALQIQSDAEQDELQIAVTARDNATREADRVKNELQELEGEVIRLQTEITIAKAELDTAYGSRAQRAADAAANPAIQKELSDLKDRNYALAMELDGLKSEHSHEMTILRGNHSEEIAALTSEHSEELFSLKGGHLREIAIMKSQHSHEFDSLRSAHAEKVAALETQAPAAGEGSEALQEKVKMLKQELTETIQEYEELTKSSVEFEREREQYESLIDNLRERCEMLETQLSDEKVRWLGVKSPGLMSRDGSQSETTSTMVLKNEFKKMMRDTRAESMKALRVRNLLQSTPIGTNIW